MLNIYHRSLLGNLVASYLPREMTRDGIEIIPGISGEKLSGEKETKIKEEVARLNIWGSLHDLILAGRVHGFAIGVIILEGHDVESELVIKNIKRGQFKKILVLNCEQLDNSKSEGHNLDLHGDYIDNNGFFVSDEGVGYGLYGKKIHQSRCIMMNGDPRLDERNNKRYSRGGYFKGVPVFKGLPERLKAVQNGDPVVGGYNTHQDILDVILYIKTRLSGGISGYFLELLGVSPDYFKYVTTEDAENYCSMVEDMQYQCLGHYIDNLYQVVAKSAGFSLREYNAFRWRFKKIDLTQKDS